MFATDTNFLREPANARARTIPQTCDHSEPRLWCIAAVACMCYSPSCYQLLMSEPPPTLSELSLIPRPEALLPCLEQGGLLVCIQVPHLSTQKNHRDRGPPREQPGRHWNSGSRHAGKRKRRTQFIILSLPIVCKSRQPDAY